MKTRCRPPPGPYDNIADMKKQMKAMGLSIDWSREIATCQPEYYKSEPVAVHQDAGSRHLRAPHADRELGPGRPDRAGQRAGDRRRGWRSGALVEKREILGTTWNITKYADGCCRPWPTGSPNYLAAGLSACA